MTQVSKSAKLHQITLYTTKLDNGSTATQYIHIIASKSSLGIPEYDVMFGNLQSDIEIIADNNTYFVIKRARSGVDVDELFASEE